MADSNTICINSGNIPTGYLNYAKGELEDALAKLKSLDDYGAMANQRYVDADGKNTLLFGGELAEDVPTADIERILDKLEEYGKLLKSGPKELAGVDAAAKGQMTGLLDRAKYGIGGFVGGIACGIGSIVGGISNAVDNVVDTIVNGISQITGQAIKWLTSWFTSGGGATGDETIIEPPEGTSTTESDTSAYNKNKYYTDDATKSCREKEPGGIYDYDDGVYRGTIRYVCQNKNFDKNGWDLNINTPKEQCNIAVESMGLSYIGIDVAPRDMQNVKGADGKTTYSLDFVKDLSESSNLKDVEGKDCTVTATKLTSYDETEFEKMFKAFDGDATYSTSPVMIRYVGKRKKVVNGKEKEVDARHWILITGKGLDENGNVIYNAIGPWTDNGLNGLKEKEGFTITIGSDGTITRTDQELVDCKVVRVAQYTRTDS